MKTIYKIIVWILLLSLVVIFILDMTSIVQYNKCLYTIADDFCDEQNLTVGEAETLFNTFTCETVPNFNNTERIIPIVESQRYRYLDTEIEACSQ